MISCVLLVLFAVGLHRQLVRLTGLAGMTGPVWLVVVAAGLLRSRPGVLGCSTGTVESNTSRGLAALRRLAVDTALAG